MRRTSLIRAAVCAVALSLGAPRVAYAGDTQLSEQFFAEGVDALKAEKWEAACTAFAASNQAEPSAGAQINLGVCNEKQGKYATALTWFDAAARLAQEQGRHDRVKLARSEYARVEPQVHRLTITAEVLPEGATISRNGETRVPAGAFVGRDTPLDPGTYTFELSAKGKKPVSKQVEIPKSPGKTTLAFPALEDAPAGEPGPEGAPDGAVPPGGDRPQVVVNDGSSQRTVGVIVGAAGILALLAAGGVEILALSEQSKSEQFKSDADKETDPDNRQKLLGASGSRHQAAENDELIALITGAGGIVLVGVGVALFFTAPKGQKSAKGPRVLPVVGPGYGGASFGLTF